MKANHCVMAVTDDEYELPLAIADSFKELDSILHLPKNTSYYLMQRERNRENAKRNRRTVINFCVRVVDLNFKEEEVMVG